MRTLHTHDAQPTEDAEIRKMPKHASRQGTRNRSMTLKHVVSLLTQKFMFIKNHKHYARWEGEEEKEEEGGERERRK